LGPRFAPPPPPPQSVTRCILVISSRSPLSQSLPRGDGGSARVLSGDFTEVMTRAGHPSQPPHSKGINTRRGVHAEDAGTVPSWIRWDVLQPWCLCILHCGLCQQRRQVERVRLRTTARYRCMPQTEHYSMQLFPSFFISRGWVDEKTNLCEM
jgi:hypothetical protein